MEDKEYLSSEELAAFIKEHQGDKVFLKNEKRETILAPWLMELRSRQALYVAERILGKTITLHRWEEYWVRTTDPTALKKRGKIKKQSPNTATFGGLHQTVRPHYVKFRGPQQKKKRK
jgi:hypothetical protein